MKPLLPAVPSILSFRIHIVVASLIGIGCLAIPLNLSLELHGVIASNGPTSSLTSPTEGYVIQLPAPNSAIKKNAILFRFQQPVIAADIVGLIEKQQDLKSRLTRSVSECEPLIQSAEKSLSNAKDSYSLNQAAFKEQAISLLNMLQYRDRVDQYNQELIKQRNECRREADILRTELANVKSELLKYRSTSTFKDRLLAPDSGIVHSIIIKNGERVDSGQLLGMFTASGSTGAELQIPAENRPFILIGDRYSVRSNAYSFLAKEPERSCVIKTITPDVVHSTSSESRPSMFTSTCRFDKPTDQGPYPLLVGMEVHAYGGAKPASLFLILLHGYRTNILKE